MNNIISTVVLSSLSLLLILSTFYLSLVVIDVSCASSSYELREVATGFTWAENLIFDGHGSLFVTDAQRGELWRIHRAGSGDDKYVQEMFIDASKHPFKRMLGLAVTPDGNTLYIVAQAHGQSGSSILRMNTTVPDAFATVAQLPKVGNGLALHTVTGLLYCTTEGMFLPKNGEVFQVNPVNGTVRSIMRPYAADGAWIDQRRHLLYVSQVIGSTVDVYDLVQQRQIRSFKPPRVTMLDDYTLDNVDDTHIYGADFWSGTVVRFNVTQTAKAGEGKDNDTTTIIAQGLKSPTSARWARGKGFESSSLFVTEGGGLLKSVKDRRVFEIMGVRPSLQQQQQ